MELYMLNRELDRIGVVPEYNSLVWVSRAWDHSEATLKCPLGVMPADAVFLQRSDTDEAMKITRRHHVSKEGDRFSEIGCKGATILFERRVNWWTKSFTDMDLADAAAVLAADAQATYEGIDRTIPGMALALANLTRTPHPITKQASWGQVSDVLFDLVRTAGFSFGVRYADGQLEPFVRRGYDLSDSVVFSTDFSDVAGAEADVDRTEAANLAVVGGQGQAAARIVTTIAAPNGDELAELWVDADDLNPEEFTEVQYFEVLRQRGAEKVAALPVTDSVEATITQDRYRYRDDYDLGDRVAFRAFGREVSDIISEVTEVIEEGEHRVVVGLGQTAPVLRDLLR